MTMHGRVKTRTTAEQKEIARQEKLKIAKTNRDAMGIILEKRSSGVYDQETLDISGNLLIVNPDVLTLWNYRREMFLDLETSKDSESYQKVLEKELSLTEQCLRVNPKSYASWHHRIWVLQHLPEPDWGRELALCTKYLQMDERNFHCWDYRRMVAQKSGVSDVDEYKYTLDKIETNFSNYSAWHLRSKLLPKIFPDPEKKFPIDEVKHKEELELVENAAFTDPNDQSAWFYQRWLLGLTEPKISLVHVEAKEDEIFVVTSRSLKMNDDLRVGVTMRAEINKEPAKGVWTNNSNQIQSSVWSFKPDSKIQPTDSIALIMEENGIEFKRQNLEPMTVIRNEPNFLPTYSDNLRETILNQLTSCEQLLEIEPDSKWTLLTSVLLMLFVDSDLYENQIMDGLEKLMEVDPLRRGYYRDLRSRIVCEWAIVDRWEERSHRFELTNAKLTCLYHCQYLHDCTHVDLSSNDLGSDSLKQFHVLFNCEWLNLTGNKIDTLRTFPVLPKLKSLLLDNNQIETIDEECMSKFPNLTSLSLSGNPLKTQIDLSRLGS